MECTVKPFEDCTNDEIAAISKLSKQSSDLQSTLMAGEFPGGQIAIVREGGAVVGWARTEGWHTEEYGYWDTLEAFVCEKFRGRGVATFAASGLRAAEAVEMTSVAVFHPKMLMVAKSAGLFPMLFEKGQDGKWKRA